MGKKGTVARVQLEEFEWRIYDFSSLTEPYVWSPPFSFAGETWYLRLYPKGSRRDVSSGFLSIFLCRITSSHPIELKFSLGLKTAGGKKDRDIHSSKAFKMANHTWGRDKILSRSELCERKSDYLPSDVLTVFCTMWYPTEGVSGFATEKCSYCKLTLDAGEDMSSHQQKCMNKPVKCPECGDVVLLKNWFDHECKIADAEAAEIFTATEKLAAPEKPVAIEKPATTEKLCDAFKQILLSGDHSDTTIKVKGEDFRLHKSILGARSPYFDLMFKNEMRENITGIVTIDDCEPDTFRSYIHFLYTGEADHISAENVCDLYAVADKYQDDHLKEECLQFMVNSISMDSFCDYTILAITHKEQTLLNNAIKIFACKTKEIIRSVKWQAFLSEYPIQANELLIKALDQDSA